MITVRFLYRGELVHEAGYPQVPARGDFVDIDGYWYQVTARHWVALTGLVEVSVVRSLSARDERSHPIEDL